MVGISENYLVCANIAQRVRTDHGATQVTRDRELEDLLG